MKEMIAYEMSFQGTLPYQNDMRKDPEIEPVNFISKTGDWSETAIMEILLPLRMLTTCWTISIS